MSGHLGRCLFLTVLGFSSLALADEVREWVDKTGKFKVEAELVESTDKGVKLRKQDGKIVTVPIDRLSQGDLDYLKAKGKEEKEAEKVAATPIESVVRINVPVEGASGPEKDLVVVGFAIEVKGQPSPIVLAIRSDLSRRVPEEREDESLAKSTFLHLRQDRELGAIERLGVPRPPQGEWEIHDRLVVLVGDAKAKIPALQLADRDAEVGDVVQVPLLPQPTRNSNTRRTAQPEIKWTKWKIDSINAFGMFMIPIDGKYPHSGALPIVDAENKVVGVYASMGKASEASELQGVGFPLSDIRGALTKAKLLQGNADATPSADKSLFPGVMAIPQGPVDTSAAWRSDYDEFVKTIKVTKGADGEWEFDWGEAQDFGAWYERCRVVGGKMDEMMRNPEKRRQLVKELEPMMKERDLAGERLQGIEWEAVARVITAKSTSSSVLTLTPLPDPLSFGFFVEEGNEDAWRQVNQGDKVRFGCRLVVKTMSANPTVFVYMTFKEVVKE